MNVRREFPMTFYDVVSRGGTFAAAADRGRLGIGVRLAATACPPVIALHSILAGGRHFRSHNVGQSSFRV